MPASHTSFQGNKLRHCRQVVRIPTVGTFRFNSYLSIKALVFLFASLGPLIAERAVEFPACVF
jgi:hypothetical protein